MTVALLALLALGLLAASAEGFTQTDTGAGINYRLSITQDVTLERGSTNSNSLEYLIVGFHPGFPKKRSLVQFESLPSNCARSKIKSAKMYLYYVYAHKASYNSVQQVPFISRMLQVNRVIKEWNEMQATSTRRKSGIDWSTPYLGLNKTDAHPKRIDRVTMTTYRPRGWVEFNIIRAMRRWTGGRPNYGLVVWATNEDIPGREFRFASNAASDASTHAFVNVLCDY